MTISVETRRAYTEHMIRACSESIAKRSPWQPLSLEQFEAIKTKATDEAKRVTGQTRDARIGA